MVAQCVVVFTSPRDLWSWKNANKTSKHVTPRFFFFQILSKASHLCCMWNTKKHGRLFAASFITWSSCDPFLLGQMCGGAVMTLTATWPLCLLKQHRLKLHAAPNLPLLHVCSDQLLKGQRSTGFCILSLTNQMKTKLSAKILVDTAVCLPQNGV